MPNPIRVEETFQTLVEDIEGIESIRQRNSMLREFFYFLNGDYKKFESYIVELIHYWPLYSSPITYSGIPPTEIADDLGLFQEIAEEVETLGLLDKYNDITARLTEVLVIMYLWVGESDSAYELLEFTDDLLSRQVKTGNGSVDPDAKKLLFNELREVLTSETSKNWERKTGLKTSRIVRDLDYIIREKKENEVLVPVVETFETLNGKDISYGRLRRIRVTVTGENDQPYDQIRRRFNIVGVEKPLLLEDSDIPLAARNLLERFSPRKRIKNFHGELNYEFSGAMHKGRSFNAAIAALWFTGLQKKADLRERYQLYTNIAITGDIDKDGKLIPVAVNSIKSKVYAAFYSWVTILVVPLSQAEIFRKELGELNEIHSKNQLTLIAAERLDDLFYDRRISTHMNPSTIKYAASRIWGKKFEAVGVAVIIIMALFIFRLLYGPLDKNPVLYEFSGEVLQIMNQSGVMLEEIRVGENTVFTANYPSSNPYEIVDFADVSGNEIQEIIWAEYSPSSPGKIYMKESGDNEILWSHELKYDLTFPNKPYVFQNDFTVKKLIAGDFLKDQNTDLLVSANHITYFPGILSLRNGETGNEQSKFINPGYIYDYIIEDINGDGKMEVAIGGISNAYNKAFLAILDIEEVKGYAPYTDEYALEGYEPANMLSYMLFPKSIVGETIATSSSHSSIFQINFLEEYGLLELYMMDFLNYEIKNKNIKEGRLHLYLNSDFSVQSIGTSNEYDEAADYLYEIGAIERYPDYKYLEEYKNSILYWNGEEFTNRTED
ncbi:hypothetical protein [Rhodohalobacter sp. 8-1]|uniref:hypothetical protein n=1 Tax=Rhodohalobacter sp. 8-1 TaxID=3131972 RepID=UPI0030EDBA5E